MLMPGQFSMPGVPLVQANLVQTPSPSIDSSLRARETRRRPGTSKNDACEFCGKVGVFWLGRFLIFSGLQKHVKPDCPQKNAYWRAALQM